MGFIDADALNELAASIINKEYSAYLTRLLASNL
jgi:hypothetical protein